MSFPDIGATGIIAAVIIALAVIGFLKGLMRTVLALVCLGIAGYAALWGNEHASDLTSPWIENPGPWMPKVIGIATGLVIFFICRYILHFLVNPFNQSKTGKKIGFGLPAAALSLCAGLAILWLGFTGIRYGGSLAELRHIRELINQRDDETMDYSLPILLRAKNALDASSPGNWQQRIDPFNDPERLKLCKLLILYHHSPTRQQMLNEQNLNTLLNRTSFLELAYEESVSALAQSGSPRDLFHSPPVNTFLLSEAHRETIIQLPSNSISSYIPVPGDQN
ncbi:MAG: CvpA family protein [Akkermansiaceae bacterium]